MADVAELKTAAEKLRRWIMEIRHESSPSPYDGADEDVRTLERVAALLDDAAEEIQRLRISLKGD